MGQMTNEPPVQTDFSLVLGGPLHQMWRRTRLTDDAMQLLLDRLLEVVF
jgi:hypothetical protein